MTWGKLFIGTLAVALVSTGLFGQAKRTRRNNPRAYPPTMEGAEVEVYKSVGDTKLALYIFQPKDRQPDKRYPAIVFFFGGGWTSGSPGQFEHQCRYLASRGMVAITADYRVQSRHGVQVPQCIADAKSAIRWVRSHADRLGIDPDRIAAGGGSAGGHLAAATGLIESFDEPAEDRSVRSTPDAMILFNPAAALAPFEGSAAFDPEQAKNLRKRLGEDPVAVSPAHHVRPGAPPTIIFFGTNDRLLKGGRYLQERMKAEGNRCELRTWDGLPHGFFNWGRYDNKPFVETVRAADQFFASLGYLEGEPTISDYPTPMEKPTPKKQ